MGEVLLAALIIYLDQLVKAKVLETIPPYGKAELIPGVLGLTCVFNSGASWSILAGKTVFLLIVTALVCAAIFAALLLGRPKNALARMGLGLVLGGAVGNALDRLANGYVTDMFETLFMDFPIFNVADCFITVGGVFFCLAVILDELGSRKKPEPVQVTEKEKEEVVIPKKEEEDGAGADGGG